jgi:hypothetical protein
MDVSLALLLPQQLQNMPRKMLFDFGVTRDGSDKLSSQDSETSRVSRRAE